MTLPGPSVPGRQFLDRHSNPNPDPNPIPNPVQELTVQESHVTDGPGTDVTPLTYIPVSFLFLWFGLGLKIGLGLG